jgi:hypothetical protein
MGYMSTDIQGGRIMERFIFRGPLSERGEGALEHEDGRRYPGGRVSRKKEREVYCVRFNNRPNSYVTRLAEDLTPITANEALVMYRQQTGEKKLPKKDASTIPSRCGHPY